jgi:hypothetical protein
MECFLEDDDSKFQLRPVLGSAFGSGPIQMVNKCHVLRPFAQLLLSGIRSISRIYIVKNP